MLTIRSNDNPVRPHEILNRRALTQELRIGNDIKSDSVLLPLFDKFLDSLTRSHWHCAFRDDYFVIIDVVRQGTSNRLNLAHIWLSVGSLGSAHSDKDHQGLPDGSPQVCGKAEPTIFDILPDNLVKADLVDRNPAFVELANLLFVAVNTGYIETEIRKPCS